MTRLDQALGGEGWGILPPTDEYPNWFVYYIEYPDEGTVGPFATREEAVDWIKANPADEDEQ